MIIRTTCPYCQTEQNVCCDYAENNKSKVITCDVEDGGCEQDFIFTVNLKVTHTIKKIEGNYIPTWKIGDTIEFIAKDVLLESYMEDLDIQETSVLKALILNFDDSYLECKFLTTGLVGTIIKDEICWMDYSKMIRINGKEVKPFGE